MHSNIEGYSTLLLYLQPMDPIHITMCYLNLSAFGNVNWQNIIKINI